MAMASGPAVPVIVHRLAVPLQVLIYAGLFIVSEWLVEWLHLSLPANVIGLILMLGLIITGILPLKWVRAGSAWLLAEMLLFFVPAVVAVVNYGELLRVEGWRIMLVIVVSTMMVLGATAWVVDKVWRFELTRAARRQAENE